MSILVRGMEMPGSCIQCFFCSYNGKESFCFALRKPVIPLTDTLPDLCPLVPVPPHGRLIDADALIDAGWQLSRDNIFTGKYEIALLSSVPTIIPAEEGE